MEREIEAIDYDIQMLLLTTSRENAFFENRSNQNLLDNNDSTPVGLPNVGNSCFMNTSIQCLGASKEFQNLILDSFKKGGSITKGLFNIYTQMKKAKFVSEGTMKNFKERLSFINNDYLSPRQQDASELIFGIIGKIYEEITDMAVKEKFRKMFYSELESTVEKNVEGKETFSIFPLNIPFEEVDDVPDFFKPLKVRVFFYGNQIPSLLLRVPIREHELTFQDLIEYINFLLTDGNQEGDWFFLGLRDRSKCFKILFKITEPMKSILEKVEQSEEKELLCFQISSKNAPVKGLVRIEDENLFFDLCKKTYCYWEKKNKAPNSRPFKYTKSQPEWKTILLDFSFENQRIFFQTPVLLEVKREALTFIDLHHFIFSYILGMIDNSAKYLYNLENYEILAENQKDELFDIKAPFTLFFKENPQDFYRLPFLNVPIMEDEVFQRREMFNIKVQFNDKNLADQILEKCKNEIYFDLTKIEEMKTIIPVFHNEHSDEFFSLHECLDLFFEKSQVVKNGVAKERKYRFDTLPKILILQIKRYSPSGAKYSTGITFPLELQLSNYCVPGKTENTNYKLISIANHNGNNLNCGHYYSILKKGEKWYYVSDEKVTETSADKLRNSKRLQEPYIFFYERVEP